MYEKYIGINGNMLYRKILRDILLNGQDVRPRGKRTLEIQAITQIIEPRQRVLTVPGRGNNPFFNVAENLAIVGAWQEQRQWMGTFNKNYLQFFDNDKDEQTWAFYGDRLRRFPGPHGKIDQFREITDKLEKDPMSRQAMGVLWHPELDNAPGHKDYPCNFAVKFYIRNFTEIDDFNKTQTTNEVLHMTVFNRSNDIHWGLFGVNLSQWSFIQEVMAHVLGVPVGHQIHVSDSLHLYTDEPHATITKNMAQYTDGFDVYTYVDPRLMFGGKQLNWDTLDAMLLEWKNHFFQLIEHYQRHTEDIEKPDSFVSTPHFPDWPFLEDAWWFLHAYLVRRNRQKALNLIDRVTDSALWLVGTEWMVRGSIGKVDRDQINREVKKRFPEKGKVTGRMDSTSSALSAEQDIIAYIMSSNILQEVKV